jgi:hypothetical protein
MNLYLAIFWLVLGVLVQVFWTTVEPHATFHVDRTFMGVVFFVLFSYNFIRWRMQCMMRRGRDDTNEPPPKPRAIHREYDPTFDFSKPDPDDQKKNPPTA